MTRIYEVETKDGRILRRYRVIHLPTKMEGTVIAENPASASRQCGWKFEECEIQSVPFYMAQIGDSTPVIKEVKS